MDPFPERATVVIVGGGFAGAATAWWLVRGGVRDVVVLEREDRLGKHASGRNAGMCRQIAEDDRWTELCVRGAEFLRRPPKGFAPAPLLAVTGSLLLADDPATLAALAGRAHTHGIGHHLVHPDAVAAVVPAAAGLPCVGAVHTPDDGIIDIAALLRGFVDGARAGGARVVLGAEVLAVRAGGDDDAVALVTSRGTVRTTVVVSAGGAWAGSVGALAGAIDVDFAAMKRHVFLLDGDGGPELGAPFVWHVGDREVYVRNGADGLMASGCDGRRTLPGEVEVEPAAAAELMARLAAAPALASRPITGAWACQRTFSPEGSPRVGWDRDVPWLCWAAGLGGHGATTASAIGEDAAAAISSRL